MQRVRDRRRNCARPADFVAPSDAEAGETSGETTAHWRCCFELQKAALVWSPAPEAAHAHVSKPSPGSAAGTPPTPAPTPGGGGGSHNNNNGANGGHLAQQHVNHPGGHAPGGPNGNNPPAQAGLMHWMSVMAEHMTNPHHHDVHYMWNGVEVAHFPSFSILSRLPTTTSGISRLFTRL